MVGTPAVATDGLLRRTEAKEGFSLTPAQPTTEASPGTVFLVGLPASHATRLCATLHDALGVTGVVADATDRIPPDAWILCTPEWVDRIVHRPPERSEEALRRVAVLWGNRPLNEATRRWTEQGLTVLTGALPQPVLAWAQALVRSSEEAFLTWDASPSASPDAALAWTPTEPDPGLIPVPRMGDRRPASRIVAVYSSGGGVGKTTTAVYLATVAARRRHPAIVLELDEDRRGILTYWNQRPREGLDSIPAADWTDPDRLAERLATLAVTVTPRLTVVPMAGTVTGLQYPVDQGAAAITHLLAWARRQGGWTLVDLPARLRDHTILHVLHGVDQVIWVVEPTEVMLESSRLYLDLLEQLGPEGAAVVRKVVLLANKVEKARAARLDPRAFAEALGLPLLGSVASNPVKYLSGINQHRVDPTAEWEHVADGLGMTPAEVAGDRGRGWWRPRNRRKEYRT